MAEAQPVANPSKAAAPLRSREPIWSLRKPLPSSYQLGLGLATPLLLLALWLALTSGPKPLIGALFLPSPMEVLRVLIRDLFTGERVLFDAAIVSTMRIVLSFALAAVIALPLGILMGA